MITYLWTKTTQCASRDQSLACDCPSSARLCCGCTSPLMPVKPACSHLPHASGQPRQTEQSQKVARHVETTTTNNFESRIRVPTRSNPQTTTTTASLGVMVQEKYRQVNTFASFVLVAFFFLSSFFLRARKRERARQTVNSAKSS